MEIVDLGVALEEADDISELLPLGPRVLSCELLRVPAQGSRKLPPAPGRERILLALGGSATLILGELRQTLASGLLLGLAEDSAIELQCEGTAPFEGLLILCNASKEAST